VIAIGTSWRSFLNVSAGVLLTLCVLVYLRPYYGIRHDGILYLGQALLRLRPELFGDDLFFAFGSQADYTIFPHLLARMLAHVPADELFLVLTFVGRIAFLVASFALVRKLLIGRQQFLAMLALLVLPSGYGGYLVFSYAEPFLTARSFAEPLLLLAVAAILDSRWLLAVAAWVIATALHPLQAISGALVVWVYCVLKDRRWLHVAWLLCPLVLLGFAGTAPFDLLLRRFDSEWLEWIHTPNRHVFLHRWRLVDWCYLATDVFLVWQVRHCSGGRFTTISSALLWATALALSTSIIFSDLLNLVLPTGLQFWRVQWLLHWFAVATLPLQLTELFEAGPIERPRLAILVAIAVLGSPLGPTTQPFAILGLIPLFLLWPKVSGETDYWARRAVLIATSLALFVSVANYALIVLTRYEQYYSNREMLRPEYLLLAHPLIASTLLLLGIRNWDHLRDSVRLGGVALLSCFLIYSLHGWDRRITITRLIEKDLSESRPFGVSLGSRGDVLWSDNSWTEPLLASWLTLGRPSYFGDQQLSGLLFSRDTAREADRRQKVIGIFRLHEEFCGILNDVSGKPDACAPDEVSLREACKASNGKLSYVVTPRRLDGYVFGQWRIPVLRSGDIEVTYYLYRCVDFWSS
jgi:hypothetical protein